MHPESSELHDAVGAMGPTVEVFWTPRDCAIYALSVGAGYGDLAYAVEDSQSQRVLPTFVTALAHPLGVGIHEVLGNLKDGVGLHAETSVVLNGALPLEGMAELTSAVVDVADKGSGSLVTTETIGRVRGSSKNGFVVRSAVFYRGSGGWGGPRGESRKWETPKGDPTFTEILRFGSNQSLLYRAATHYWTGPVHYDPEFAAGHGFHRPLIHGLCVLGFAAQVLIRYGHPTVPAARYNVRYEAPCFPGETVEMSVWVGEDDGCEFELLNSEHKRVLVGNAR